MKLTGLHLLLSYTCTYECAHCFVWSSPWQSGTMTIEQVRHILQEGKDLGTVDTIYFEGGEPFLFYPVLVQSVNTAIDMGFKVGMVSNSYWATSVEDAAEWLRPFVGKVMDLSLSDDDYHGAGDVALRVRNAVAAAQQLNIPMGTISIAGPDSQAAQGQLPAGQSRVMYRGRAAVKLAPDAPKHPWDSFTTCPFENLRDPGRVHVDPLGHLHICQGISLGNIFETPLADIIAAYDPDTYPVTGDLLRGGPAELARWHDFEPESGYADACHLCYTVRAAIRDRLPQVLTPAQMYGVEG